MGWVGWVGRTPADGGRGSAEPCVFLQKYIHFEIFDTYETSKNRVLRFLVSPSPDRARSGRIQKNNNVNVTERISEAGSAESHMFRSRHAWFGKIEGRKVCWDIWSPNVSGRVYKKVIGQHRLAHSFTLQSCKFT